MILQPPKILVEYLAFCTFFTIPLMYGKYQRHELLHISDREMGAIVLIASTFFGSYKFAFMVQEYIKNLDAKKSRK